MSVVLFHHPQTRAAGVVWMLEEVGCDYTLRFVDVRGGAQKQPDVVAVNPMGKVPTLVDGEAVVTEAAAIGMYLADRYAPGRLAPALDDPARGTYLRWCLFAPSVIEPGCMAKAAGWAFGEGTAGWGNFDAMVGTIEAAVGEGPWVLGDSFSMADVVFGGTVRWMLQFGMLPERPVLTAYRDRLDARPAAQRAAEINARIATEQGIG